MTPHESCITTGFLSVMTTNKFETWNASSFNDDSALIDNSSFSELIRIYGLEIVLIWTAAILKKRICVFSENLQVAQKAAR